jgi:hypothetical protein
MCPKRPSSRERLQSAARLARITGTDPVAVVSRLARSHNGPTTLSALGVPRDGLHAVAERVVARPYPNPRPLTVDGIDELLNQAWQRCGQWPNAWSAAADARATLCGLSVRSSSYRRRRLHSALANIYCARRRAPVRPVLHSEHSALCTFLQFPHHQQ